MTERDREPWTEDELRRYFPEEEEEEEPAPPYVQGKLFKRIIAVIAVVALFANVLAFLPQIYSLAAVRFLAASARLSQSPDIREYKEAVVVVTGNGSKGTGFHLAEYPGLIATNRHVVDDLPRVTVSFPNGRAYAAEIVLRGETDDLALLRVEGAEREAGLTMAASSDGTAGQRIYVIGNPLFFNGIVNEGVVLEPVGHRGQRTLVLQAPIYRGNSGSPVIGADGRVIGVVYATARIERDGDVGTAGLAVPVERLRRLLKGWEAREARRSP